MTPQPNKAPAPNRRPRSPLGGWSGFGHSVCAQPASPASVGEAQRWAPVCQPLNNTMKRQLTKMILILTLASLAAFSTGCVGVMVSHTQRQTYDCPSIGDKPAADAVFAPAGMSSGCIAADKLRNSWGEPQAIRPHPNDPQCEVWTYKFGRFWCGVIPCVVIPIPLVAPLAREQVQFVVSGGRVIRAEATKRDVSGTGYAFVSPDGPRSF
jgi:hypothetical protein